MITDPHEEEPVHSRLATRLAPLFSVAALFAGCSDFDRAVAPKLSSPFFNHTVTSAGPSRIVFQSNRDGDFEIFTMNTDGSDVKQLTFNTTGDYLPIWSPDGRRIVWGACADVCDVVVMNADGSDQHVVFHGGFPGAWSPDGNRIAFGGGGDFGEAVWVINTDGSGLTRVAEPQFITGWSPDGKQLQLENDYDGDFEIYVLNLDSGVITQITNNTFSDYGNGWSPDGSRMAFVSDRDGDPELFVMNADGGGEPTQLTHDGFPKGDASWSPDGTQIVFDSNRDGTPQIYVMNADGSAVTQLTFDVGIENGGAGWGQPLSLSNDDFAGASAIPALPYSDDVNLNLASTEAAEPVPSCVAFYGPLSRTAWYAFTPTETRLVSGSIVNPQIYTVVAAYTGSELGGLTEVGCGAFGQNATFRAEAGTTYYFLIGSLFGQSAQVEFLLQVTPPPVAGFGFFPSDPSTFDAIQFFDFSFDPGGLGIASQEWHFGDGASGSGCCPTHTYAAEGSYTTQLTVTTPDGRTAATSQTLVVKTHDVAIIKFSAPTAASAGQTRHITVGLNSKRYPETVIVQLFKSAPGVPGGYEFLGLLTQVVPVRGTNRTTDFDFSYLFLAADAQVGKVTFRAVAYIGGARDALPADNEAIAPPTKVNR